MSVPPPPGLMALQAAFARSIRTPLLLEDDGYRYDSGAWAASILAEMADGPLLAGPERLAVYNQQYWFRLLDVLQEELPTLRALLGDRDFNRLAMAYLDRYPSRHPELQHLVCDLERFLVGGDQPWQEALLHQAACLDLAYNRCFYALEHRDFSGAELDEAQLGALLTGPLPFQEAWYLVEADADLVALRRSARALGDSERTAMSAKPGPHCWVVYRGRQALGAEPLRPIQQALLQRLAAGASLSDACDAVETGADAAGRAELAQHIAAWFSRWARLGWFRAPTAAGPVP